MSETNRHGIKRIKETRQRRKKGYGSGVNDTFNRLQIYDKTRGKCYYCGCKILYGQMTVDHKHPKYKGGKDDLENLVPACWDCNQDKSFLTLEQYRKRVFGDEDEKFYGEKI
jgi:5-methylcytosine-specific restriction endonuclease McrA